uniref:Zinc finger protein Pegasus n=1 Tax=Petromyzon marinus TaxID=7757 RepID=S4RIL0_PETMA
GEKPFRCHLCPFASAYVRHLEAHTHSHTGEKPYKCNLCSFRCGDRSNLSHHRRRRHEASGYGGAAAAAAHLLEGRPLGQPSMSVEHISGLGLEVDCGSRAVRIEECSQKVICWKTGRIIDEVGYEKDYGIINSDTEEHIQGYSTDDLASRKKDKQTQRNSHNLEALSKSPVIASTYSLTQHSPNQSRPEKQPQHQTHRQPRCHSQSCSPHTSSSYAGNTPRSRSSSSSSSSSSGAVILPVPHVSRALLTNSHSSLGFPGPGTVAPVDGHTCPHCGIWFPDNVLFTIHMGCHGHDNPFWCNLCGRRCHDRYDFNCHFALGQHR